MRRGRGALCQGASGASVVYQAPLRQKGGIYRGKWVTDSKNILM